MTPFPTATTLVLADAHVPEAVAGGTGGTLMRRDITIVDGMVTAMTAPGSAPPPPDAVVYACDGGLVLPGLVDIHTHLDKGHIWPRKQNPDGSWIGALTAVMADREARWSASDVERRMDFALRCAYAHGTVAVRTHIDSVPPQHTISWDILTAMRERWAGRIELQATALTSPDNLLDAPFLDELARTVKAAGGILGGSVAGGTDARKAVFNVVEKAGEYGLDLDLHIDETLGPEASALGHLADAVIETGFAGPVLAGHCCSLSQQDDATAKRAIARVAEAGISVVSLPICNMYLMDRHNAGGPARTPRLRGVTLINELAAAGVKVAVSSDNTRDPFYAYGDLDMLEVFREAARILHFDHPQQHAWNWFRAASAGAAEIGGFNYSGTIAVGQPADLIVVRARSWTELNARPQADRVVLRAGVPIDTTLPDYRELDDLMG